MKVKEKGNAFTILASTDRALRNCGAEKSLRDQFYAEATSGDFDLLIETAKRWISELGAGDASFDEGSYSLFYRN